MKTHPNSGERMNFPSPNHPTANVSELSLQQLINQLLGNAMATAFRSKSLITNDVSREVLLCKDRVTVLPVIRELLSTVVLNARNGNIHISAERFRDIITLQVQDRNNNNGYALAYSIRTMEGDAAMVGGNITIDGEQKRVITISFSFPNNAGVMQYDC